MSSEFNPAIDSSAWFIKDEDVKDIPAPARELLESYANVAPEDILPHVLKLRKEAFALYPWPCIGKLRFLCPSLPKYAVYPDILTRLKTDPSTQLLDVGCCFGQDLRKLVVDGVNASQLAGLDLHSEFNKLGKRLFRDAANLQFDFYARDIFDDNADWRPLEQRFDIIHITSFLHIWNWNDQVRAAQRLVKLIRPKTGAFLVGSGLGSVVGKEGPNLDGTGTSYRQSEESFKRLWEEVGNLTEAKWDVKSRFEKLPADKRHGGQVQVDQDLGILSFEVRLLYTV